jgi:hypothetical protein
VSKLALPAVAPVTGSVCDIQMNKVTYVNGDTVIAQTLRLTTNSGTPPVPIELKLWMGVPTTPPSSFSFASFGADGSVQLPPGFSQNFGPVTLFTVSSGLPRGSYEFSCRLLDPVTFDLLAEDLNPFTIQ